MERECSKYGAKHRLKKVKIFMKDTDEEHCKNCGEELIRWTKSTTTYVAELIKKN